MLPRNNNPENTTSSASPSKGPKLNKEQLKLKVKEHMQSRVMVVDDVDKQIWELVSIMPYVSKPMAWISFIVNIVLPGFGTMLATCSARETVSKTHLIIGFL